ncbi:hypothetical protein ACFYU5_03500 [Nocardia aobensis]|uniref:Uncharacterized protein n=1 Tax=Nocardia aobensis TaxID=257277 RepID=A0ABW6NW84_9NOCA
MSLVYRALWRDDRPDLCPRSLEDLRRWIESKFGDQIQVLNSGAAEARVHAHGDEILVDILVEPAVAEDNSLSVLRAGVAEMRADGSRWQTTLRVWQGPGTEEGHVWVDVSVVGDDINLQTLAPAAPRLVRSMLSAAVNPRLGPLPLWPTVMPFSGETGGERLAELVSHFDRTVPVVVFARDDARFKHFGRPGYTFDSLVSRVADKVAGVANVAVVDKPGATAFTNALGDSHGVWDGAFRVYLANLDPAAPDDAWRHRYVTADRYMGRSSTAADLVARMLSTISPTRRPPDSFKFAKRLLDETRTGKKDFDEFISYVDSEIARQAKDIIDLRQRVSELEAERLGFEDDQSTLLDELDLATHRELELHRRCQHYEALLHSAGIQDDSLPHTLAQPVIPLDAANPTRAVEQARKYLSDRLVIPDEALVDLDKLDFSVNSGSWGRTAWRGLRALHAYACALATDESTSSFWNWCKDSGHPLVWPASKKRMAMSESETVRSGKKKLRPQRVLPVSTEVDRTGRIFMEAHLKVAEGGGNLAPRIYFHVDTALAKVHVGYFGPHYNMKNTKS